ncbi:MAG TPA: polyribonucleotide nucleotidyltransferase, partial [Dehalococcoidia bacterium]|nr:polyribonucleotide nucleotidyltransferase [Dehalococcoidia bacterium]
MSSIYQVDLDGSPLIIETGRLAHQANGSATVAFGETVVLVTACASPEPRDIDFFPLTIDFEQRLYAVGKIPGAFPRREGRPSDDAILAGRMIDRGLRPLFPKGFRNEVQVIITPLSADQENNPDVIAAVGASVALAISDIPFEGPVATLRVGRIDGKFILNPTFTQLKESDLDLVVSSTREKVIMVEAGGDSVPEDVMVEAIAYAHQRNQEIIAVQDQMVAELGKPKMEVRAKVMDTRAHEAIAAYLADRTQEILSSVKQEREEGRRERMAELIERFEDEFGVEQIAMALDAVIKQTVRDNVLKNGLRPDGRRVDELRPISCDVGILPRTHGSGLFQRGETQVLTIATLGPMSMQQKIDTLSPEEHKRFMHHYNFPPFSVGEVRRLGGVGRREIGHGALGEKALLPVIPSEDEFPYTIRLVSEVIGSNGSTSQASICGSTLALMDAGVPIKDMVAGVAMGLVTGEDGDYKILTDIAGLEDALGDMDFKVAGTRRGITAIQADFKIRGLSIDLIREIIYRAREARLFILDKLAETISKPRAELSRYAPRMYRIQIPPSKIGVVIGPGGKTVRSIVDETKCTIDVQDDGTVLVGSNNEEAARKAIAIIEGLTQEAQVGQIYTGRVTRTVDFGAFVEIMPGKEGLVRIGELADYRVPSVEDVVKVGDEIMVMVTEIDNMGRINLSRRAVLEGAQPGEEEEETGEIPSPLTRRASTLTPMRSATPPRPVGRQDGRPG